MADLSNPTRHGNTWHFADGTQLPVIAGGDETATPADINSVLDRIESDTPAAANTGDAPAAPAADSDPYETGADNFDRAYVEKLRKESAKYRDERNQTRDELGRFTTAFEGWDDTARETFLNLPAALRDDPKGTAAWMRAEAERILEDGAAEVDDPRDGTDEDRPLTRKEVDRILAERDQQAAVADQVNTIYRELEGLGVGKDSEQATAIMSIAASHTGGDITKAFYLMAQWAQEAVDKFVDGKKGDADRATRPTPATGNSAGPADKPITSLKGARAGLEAYLEAQGVK